ncbi:unnamed protein product [marine sediment metagenome]|uniref:Uncharacterized protein n=1 Tax=marine sediment metagenome TaxID=412755 RepID=X1CVM9_9ZZZZ
MEPLLLSIYSSSEAISISRAPTFKELHIFEEGGLGTAQELPKEEAAPVAEEIVSELSKELEKKEVVTPVEKPPESVKETVEKKEKPTATETLAEISLANSGNCRGF